MGDNPIPKTKQESKSESKKDSLIYESESHISIETTKLRHSLIIHCLPQNFGIFDSYSCIKSETFLDPNDPNVSWQLILYPYNCFPDGIFGKTVLKLKLSTTNANGNIKLRVASKVSLKFDGKNYCMDNGKITITEFCLTKQNGSIEKDILSTPADKFECYCKSGKPFVIVCDFEYRRGVTT